MPESHLGKALVCRGCETPLRVVAAAGQVGSGTPEVCLVIQAGPHRLGEQLFLTGDLPLQIGKLPGSDIRLQGKKVSRTHCRLVRSGAGWRVEDEASTNGLFVNGQRVSSHELHDGDRIRIGDYRLKYVVEAKAPAEAGPVIAVTEFAAPKTRAAAPAEAQPKPKPPPKPPPPAPAEPPPPPEPAEEEYVVAEVEEVPDDEWAALASGGEKIATAAGATGVGYEEDAVGSAIGPARRSQLSAEELVRAGRAAAAGETRRSGFWADVGKTLVLFIDPNNLIMLIVLWVLHALIPLLTFALCLVLVCYIIVYGWLCSYWFKVIVESAAGEERLPGLSLSEGWLEDIVLPLVRFIVASIVAGIPAFIAGVVVMVTTAATFDDLTQDPTTPLIVMTAVSLFLWPIVLLVIAIGGVGAVLRADLIFLTIAKTIGPYLVVCLLFAGAWVTRSMAFELAAEVTGGPVSGFGVTLLLGALLQAYLGIVAMRIVGLYYHHFKKRFAWDWG